MNNEVLLIIKDKELNAFRCRSRYEALKFAQELCSLWFDYKVEDEYFIKNSNEIDNEEQRSGMTFEYRIFNWSDL